MSCSVNAWAPVSTGTSAPAVAFAVRTAVSRIVVPDSRVRANASSSPYATWEMRLKSSATFGYDALIASRLTGSRCGRVASWTPSSRMERTVRRSSRRST